MQQNAKQEWDEYRTRELSGVLPILTELGFALDEAQPHMEGERYLMQAVTTTSGRKLILLGKDAEGRRVVIKATRDKGGAQELSHERTCRSVLNQIRFAYSLFKTPREILFLKRSGYTISIQEFIEQKSPFLARPIEEQFSFALRAFKSQESAHAATYEHAQRIRKTFGSVEAKEYLLKFESFKEQVLARKGNEGGAAVFDKASRVLAENIKTVEQYSGFLTHTDFVPHNFRIKDGEIYLLDYSSLRFGNKYEGWARFLNFMALYNPPLERALVEYVHENRTPEESLSLKLMRTYRLGEIIWYYTNAAGKSDGDLRKLNDARTVFWTRMLEAILHDVVLSEEVLEEYRSLRDALRSPEEKLRQKDLH